MWLTAFFGITVEILVCLCLYAFKDGLHSMPLVINKWAPRATYCYGADYTWHMRCAASITDFRCPVTCPITSIVQHNQFHSCLYRKLERWWVSHSVILHTSLNTLPRVTLNYSILTLDRYLCLSSWCRYVSCIVHHKRVITALNVKKNFTENTIMPNLLIRCNLKAYSEAKR